MSITRAFTTRRVKQSIQAAEQAHADNTPHRSTSIRHKISSPIELVHTTNMLSYNAPDIHPMSASSTASSQRSDDDMSDSALTNVTTPPTSPEVESSPQKRSLSPDPSHLSSFFTVPSGQAPPAPLAQQQAEAAPPVVPQRATSHSKKAYNTLVRQRSVSGMSQQSQRSLSTKASSSFSRSSSSSTSTSITSRSSGSAAAAYHRSKLSSSAAAPSSSYPTQAAPSSPPRPQPPVHHRQQPPPRREHQHQHQHRKDFSESQHPFGPELAQVSELAEEYGSVSAREQQQQQQLQLQQAAAAQAKARVAEDEADAREMRARGLLRLGAEDYLGEVRSLLAGFFPPPRPVAATWI